MSTRIIPIVADAAPGPSVSLYVSEEKIQPRTVHGWFATWRWALVWGTIVMGITGVVLWFPTWATILLPAWMVRVSEVIHYFEAILAVSAIIVWHLFFVMLRPGNYPMSWTWITGRMPLSEWRSHHGRAAKSETGIEAQPDEEETK